MSSSSELAAAAASSSTLLTPQSAHKHTHTPTSSLHVNSDTNTRRRRQRCLVGLADVNDFCGTINYFACVRHTRTQNYYPNFAEREREGGLLKAPGARTHTHRMSRKVWAHREQFKLLMWRALTGTRFANALRDACALRNHFNKQSHTTETTHIAHVRHVCVF